MTTMPVFTIKAKDRLALSALIAYRELCRAANLFDQTLEVGSAINEMRAWRDANPDMIKDPDHNHVPTK